MAAKDWSFLQAFTEYDPPPRPAWVVIIGIVFAQVLVGAIIGFSDAVLGVYAILVFPPLMGAVGGLFGCLAADRFGFAASFRASLLSGSLGLLTYGSYIVTCWLLVGRGLDLSLIEFLEALTEHGTGLAGLHIRGVGMWVLWGLELAMVVGLAAAIGWSVEIPDGPEGDGEVHSEVGDEPPPSQD